MNSQWNRRDVLKGLAAASTVLIVPQTIRAIRNDESASDQQVEIHVSPLSPHAFRLSILPLDRNAHVAVIPSDGSLVQTSWGPPIASLKAASEKTISVGNFRLQISFAPVKIVIRNQHDDVIQQLAWDESTGALSFLTGSSPLYGLGEGGPQFDRRGSVDPMRSGQDG